jgi:hypothetical protein
MAISLFGSRARALPAGAAAALMTAGTVAAIGASSAGAHAQYHAHAATAACATSALKASLGRGQGAAGSVYIPLTFTNKSGRACTLRGYPGVSAITAGGKQIGSPATRDGSTFRTVTLKPGKQRHATIRVLNTGVFSKAACKPVTSAALRIFPPNQTQSLTIKAKLSVCSKKSNPSLGVLPVK